MRTIQMTLDDDLVNDVDDAVRRLKTSRSAFTRDALRQALKRHHTLVLEEKHRAGYARKPVRPGEFDVWEKEQAWGDPWSDT
jgi:metal-responsive CopG/Arc/MetJ family transcriptional regulator